MSRQERRAKERSALKNPPTDNTSSRPPDIHLIGGKTTLNATDLSDRQIRGYALWKRASRQNGLAISFTDETTYWVSTKDANRMYRVDRIERNRRGLLRYEHRCSCPDFLKYGRQDCVHIFAERLRREEVIVCGAISRAASLKVVAERRPPRKRKSHDGKSYRTTQRRARVSMPERVPELIRMLRQEYDFGEDGKSRTTRRRGGQKRYASTRAAALLAKVAEGESADTMVSKYKTYIENGTLLLKKPPHQNTLTEWIDDRELTPVLEHFLETTAKPFRRRETAAIVDSSKLSQMQTAHSRGVEYLGDERPGADWAKVHALVGVETQIVMAAMFSGSRNACTHDSKFLVELVERGLRIFDLKYILGDKAYLAERIIGWLWQHGIKAVIPLKKRWDYTTKTLYYEACKELAEWFDEHQKDFHEIYRLRPLIESLFSHLKRLATGFCWSRGRKRKETNADVVCTAWKNEMLCKLIYVNLRITVTTEEDTGYKANYLIPDRCFPPLPHKDQLIQAA